MLNFGILYFDSWPLMLGRRSLADFQFLKKTLFIIL